MKSQTLVLAGLVLAALSSSSLAATPASGTITDTQTKLTYTIAPFTASNPTPTPEVDSGPECGGFIAPTQAQPCDDFALTVTLPAGYVAAHPHAAITVSLGWTSNTAGNSDYDLYVYKNPRSDCSPTDCTQTDGSQSADYQSSTQNDPEVATVFPLADGTKKFTVIVVPFTSGGESDLTVTIELKAGDNGGSTGGSNGTPGPCDAVTFGTADKTCANVPRYQMFFAPKGSSAESSSGEYNIGFNPHTGRIMNMNIGPIWRITPPELKPGGGAPTDSKLPESCPELWEDVSDPTTDTGLDPILWTDQVTGRTLATNSTAGGAAIYTDNDGGDPPSADQPSANWLQAAQLPNGGADHETFGSGPFPASMAVLANPVNNGEWYVYCSQDIVGPAMCQRSLTGGASWETSVPAYTGTAADCGGLHGHAHIGADGTAWLPVNQCNGNQGGAISTNTSTTPWTAFIVHGASNDAPGGVAFTAVSQANGADPSIGLDAAGTAYYCYVNNEQNGTEGHVHIAVGKLQAGTTTITWVRDVDVGAAHGIVNAAMTQAVGGSVGRAACGFLGTNVNGNYQAGDFPGVWYPYIASTYDEGKTWVTVNASPNDPVQFATGVWQQGGGGQNGDRNLLDFNEMTLDSKGRPLYGHSDGCVSSSCINDHAGNDKTAFMRVARQIGGKTLLTSADSTEPAAPKRSCLLDNAVHDGSHPDFTPSSRDMHASHLRWRAGDNNGAVITGYEIWRGTASGAETLLATTINDKTSYDDTTADPLVSDYYYYVKGINASGTSAAGNELDLKVGSVTTGGGSPCALPGVLIATDAAGDSTTSPTPGQDILALYGAELYAPSQPDKLYMTMKVDSLNPAPPNTVYYTYFNVGPVQYFLSYDTSAAPAPAGQPFSYGWVDGSQTPAQLTNCSTGSALEPESTTAPDGTILLVVTKKAINDCAKSLNQTADLSNTTTLTAVQGDIRALVGVAGTGLVTSVDSTAPAPYTQVGNGFCAPNAAPVLDTFGGSPNAGPAPLAVSFTATAHDPDSSDTVASYTFDFGDGSAPVTQATGAIAHTYTAVGAYVAKVTVTDSRSLASINSGAQQINVTKAKTSNVENNVLAGALPPAGLLVLGLLAALRRRR